MAARADSSGGVEIRDARATDTDAIRALLRRCQLPEDGMPEDAALLVVAERDGAVAGVTGLELYGADALRRSVAVSPERRGERRLARAQAPAGIAAAREFAALCPDSAVLMFREL